MRSSIPTGPAQTIMYEHRSWRRCSCTEARLSQSQQRMSDVCLQGKKKKISRKGAPSKSNGKTTLKQMDVR